MRVGEKKKIIFSARVVKKWNSLEKSAVATLEVNGFKSYLGEVGY